MFWMMFISILWLISYVAAQESAVTTSITVIDEPTICTMQYDPVCGEDGTTYGNACMAQSVKIAYTGECVEEVVDEPAPIACTREYMPVCANVQVQCIAAPCFPVQETFANRCVAEAAWTEVIFEWDCNIAQWWVTEPTASDIVTWAYDLGITKYSNTTQFMYDAPVTREQAAKMIMTAIDTSSVEQWMIKQQDGSCEWNDADQIDISLINYVDVSCEKWLFRGSNGNFMPQAYLTDTDARTVMYRVAEYVPVLADHLALVILAATNDVALTRGELLTALYTIYQQIQPVLTLDPPTLWVISWDMFIGDYHLISYNNTWVTNTGITMMLDGTNLQAKICNNINGSYSIDSQSDIYFMNVGTLISTLMACADEQVSMIENSFALWWMVELDQTDADTLVMTMIWGDTLTWEKH